MMVTCSLNPFWNEGIWGNVERWFKLIRYSDTGTQGVGECEIPASLSFLRYLNFYLIFL